MHTIKIKIVYIILATLLLSACQQTQPVRPSGYLVDYSLLKPRDDSEKTLYYEDKQAPWQSYKSIMFDEVVVKIHGDHAGTSIAKEDLRKMRNYLQRALANAACSRLEFTNKPGEGVIMLRTAIVNLKPVNVAANVVSKGLFFVPVDFGQATIEGELRDSLTGRHLASIVDRKFGNFVDPTHSYTTWGAVEDAFDNWAEELGELLDSNISE